MKKNITGLFAICLGLVIFAVPALPAGAENKANGKLTVDGKSVEITQVYTSAKPGFFDKEKQDVVVLMCDAPVTPETAKDMFGIDKLVSSGKLHCVQQTINTEKQVINFEVRHNRFKMPVSGGSSSQVFEAQIFSDNEISGRARTTAQQKSFDDIPYTYDITFSAAFDPMPGEKTGKKLPADGGELGKAYLAENKKAHSRGKMSIAEIRKIAPPGELDSMSDNDLKTMRDLSLAMEPVNPRVTGGYVSGNKGILSVTALFNKQKQYGTIEMEKQAGAWTVVNSTWSDTPPGKK
ncbi:MAG: hypothetical protein WA610_03875 [Thermodesulfovibrionales bacterium]